MWGYRVWPLTKTEDNSESLFCFQSHQWAPPNLGWRVTQLSDQFYFFPVSLSIVAQNPTWQTVYTLNSMSESASWNPVAINDKVFNLVNTYVSVSFYNLVSHVKANTIDVHIHAFHLIQTCHQHKIFFPNKKLFSTFVLNNYSIKCIRKMRKMCGINNFSVYSYSL